MEQDLKLLGVVLFGVAIFLNTRIMHRARLLLTGDQLVALLRANDPKIWTFVAGVFPMLLVYALVDIVPNHAGTVFSAAIILSFAALVATGAYHLRRARSAGMPDHYLRSYRKAHFIVSAGFVVVVAAMSYPVIVAIHAS